MLAAIPDATRESASRAVQHGALLRGPGWDVSHRVDALLEQATRAQSQEQRGAGLGPQEVAAPGLVHQAGEHDRRSGTYAGAAAAVSAPHVAATAGALRSDAVLKSLLASSPGVSMLGEGGAHAGPAAAAPSRGAYRAIPSGGGRRAARPADAAALLSAARDGVASGLRASAARLEALRSFDRQMRAVRTGWRAG